MKDMPTDLGRSETSNRITQRNPYPETQKELKKWKWQDINI